jgi:hypothetical protein
MSSVSIQQGRLWGLRANYPDAPMLKDADSGLPTLFYRKKDGDSFVNRVNKSMDAPYKIELIEVEIIEKQPGR